jgi:enoyl-CoA hydratase/carnithine racemase
MSIDLNYEEKIAILDLDDDENRFSPVLLEEINSRLDEVAGGGAHGLVTTGGGKFYSNGLDLEWLAAHGEQTQWYVNQVQSMLARVLTLPIATAAAVVGHAFGAGAMLALAHDFRVMRADRG